MDHFVTMNSLPEGIRFPAALADRIRYDETGRRLQFRGFMSKAEFDSLQELSEDWSYRRPLEELFRLCSVEPAGGRNRLLGWFTRRPQRTA